MISVCMATYNGEKFVYEQICSILSQLSEEDELIISDDNSTDSTCSIIKSFADKRIVLYENVVNEGVVKNFEYALSKAKGDYIFLSDQDDVWLSDKVFLSISKFQELEKVNSNSPLLVFSDMSVTDQKLNTIYPSFFKEKNHNLSLSPTIPILSVANRLPGNTLAFNRKALEVSLPIEDFAIMHDWWIACAVVASGGVVGVVDKPLVYYRQHTDNVLGALAKKEKSLSFSQKICYNFRIFRMTRHFFGISFFRYILNKIRLHL